MESKSTPNDINFDSVGKRLLAIRNAEELSQAQFCKPLGINQSAYQRYENDSRKTPVDVLESISTHYGVNPEWLLRGTGDVFRANKLKSDKQWKRLIILRNSSIDIGGNIRKASKALDTSEDQYLKWELNIEQLPSEKIDFIYDLVSDYINKDWWYQGVGDKFKPEVLESIHNYIESDHLENGKSLKETQKSKIDHDSYSDLLSLIEEIVHRESPNERKVFGEALKIKLKDSLK